MLALKLSSLPHLESSMNRWNAAVEEQALSRCHRLGQKRPVRVYRFLMEDSMETRSKLHLLYALGDISTYIALTRKYLSSDGNPAVKRSPRQRYPGAFASGSKAQSFHYETS